MQDSRYIDFRKFTHRHHGLRQNVHLLLQRFRKSEGHALRRWHAIRFLKRRASIGKRARAKFCVRERPAKDGADRLLPSLGAPRFAHVGRVVTFRASTGQGAIGYGRSSLISRLDDLHALPQTKDAAACVSPPPIR